MDNRKHSQFVYPDNEIYYWLFLLCYERNNNFENAEKMHNLWMYCKYFCNDYQHFYIILYEMRKKAFFLMFLWTQTSQLENSYIFAVMVCINHRKYCKHIAFGNVFFLAPLAVDIPY